MAVGCLELLHKLCSINSTMKQLHKKEIEIYEIPL